MTDLNRRHPRCKRGDDAPESVTTQEVAPTASPVCTRVCTSEPENVNAGTADAGQGDGRRAASARLDDADAAHQGQGEGATSKPVAASLESLADALLTLSPADRATLAALLAGQQADGEGNETQ